MKVNNISTVVIIYKKSDPRQIFLEIKDSTHPIVLVRGGLCPIGGNWVGKLAVKDLGPRDTIRRELLEELILTGREVDTEELVELGLADSVEKYVTRSAIEPSEEDKIMLKTLVDSIIEKLEPFGSCLNTTTREAILSADPESKRDGFTTLCCYWTSALDDDEWENLSYLQKKYGNLSNESITLMTSLNEIIKNDMSGAFCHEQFLRAFFLENGFEDAQNMRIVKHQESVYAGEILREYDEYLKRYDIVKTPYN